MSEITQSLGFDASQALQALKKLDTGLANLQTRLKSTSAVLAQFNKSATPAAINSFASATQAATAKVASSAKSNMAVATQSVERLTVSMGLLSRVVTTQLIVSAFGKIRREIAGAATDAIKFETTLAEINTLAEGSLGTIDQFGARIRELSDAFNTPAEDVAKGVYETLSAQIADGAEAFDFMASSAEFAKATLTPVGDSVTLLAGTLTAFSKDASAADEVASKLFRTIDLGNVTGKDLVTSFNRTSGRARQLGIALEEQAAAFAVLTNRGIKHAEVATQLGGVMTGLVKPTEAMKEALLQLGFSNAEVAVKTLGFGDLLKQLAGTTDGTAESFAKLFPNVRGLSGALNLGTLAADQYKSALEEIKGTSANLAKDKSVEILASRAQQFSGEINKLTNLMTNELGSSVLSGAVAMSKFTGGVDALQQLVKDTGPILATATVAVAGYAVAALTGAKNNALFAASFGKLAKGALAISAAVTIGEQIGSGINELISRQRKNFESSRNALIAFATKAAARELRIEQETGEKKLRSALQSMNDLDHVYNQDVANAHAAGDLMVRTVAFITQNIVRERAKMMSEIERGSRDALNQAQQSLDIVQRLKDSIEDRQFASQTKNLSDAQKVFALTEKAEQTASNAARLLQEGIATGNKANIDRARQQFTRAESLGQEATAMAENASNAGLLRKATESLTSTQQKWIRAEERAEQVSRSRAQNLEALANGLQTADGHMQQLATTVKNNAESLSEGIGLMPPGEVKKRQAAITAALNQMQTLGADQAVFNKLGIGDLAKTFNKSLSTQIAQLKVQTDFAPIRAQLDAGFAQYKARLQFDVSDLEQQLGVKFNSPNELKKGMEEATKRSQELAQSFVDLKVEDATIGSLREQIKLAANETDTWVAALGRASNGSAPQQYTAAVNAVKQLRTELTQVASGTTISQEQLSSLFQKLQTLQQGVGSSPTLKADLNSLGQGMQKLIELSKLLEQRSINPAVDPGAKAELESLRTTIDGFQSSFNNSARAASSLATQLERAATAARQIQIPTGGVNAAFGGRFFAKGGRGIDTIPAMLSPGEFVVNAASSGKFFTQLQAMNAGQTPVFRGDGGTTINVGDIKIDGAQNPKIVGREVINAIRREQRRGSARI